MKTSLPKIALATMLVAGCEQVPGLVGGATLKGKVSGAVLDGKTKVGILTSPSKRPIDAVVVPVDGSGNWSYTLPAGGQDTHTAFAFRDENGNGAYDSAEESTYPRSYVVASPDRNTWKIQVRETSGTREASLTEANITFA